MLLRHDIGIVIGSIIGVMRLVVEQRVRWQVLIYQVDNSRHKRNPVDRARWLEMQRAWQNWALELIIVKDQICIEDDTDQERGQCSQRPIEAMPQTNEVWIKGGGRPGRRMSSQAV